MTVFSPAIMDGVPYHIRHADKKQKTIVCKNHALPFLLSSPLAIHYPAKKSLLRNPPLSDTDKSIDPYLSAAALTGYEAPYVPPTGAGSLPAGNSYGAVNNAAPLFSPERGTASYTMTVEFDPAVSVPRFWLSGTGDHRSLALHTGLSYDHTRQQYRAPTPYHARLIWCYADVDADMALKKLFPRFGRPERPRHVPFVMATNDSIICLTSPECSERPQAAGFNYNKHGHYWETRDLRRVLPLIDVAEEDLQRRLEAITALPFDTLTDITVADLISLPPPEGAGDGGDHEEEEEQGGANPVLTFDPATSLYRCDHPAAQGAGFHASGKRQYVSDDFEHAQKLRIFADDLAELRLQADAIRRTVPDPRASDPRPIPQSPTAPFPFAPDQLEGIRFACTRRGCIIGDEMGVGKTAEAIGVINVEQPRLAIIFAPAGLLGNWEIECGNWLAPPNKAVIFGHQKDRTILPSGANVLIVSYEMAPRLPVLHSLEPDIVICDEAQEIKSEETKAGRVIYDTIGASAGKLIFMTGTPIWNRPQDLWAPLHAIAPEVFPHKANFLRLYRVTDPEKVTPEQSARLDFLAHLLKSGLMIRRLKGDVLNLPAKNHIVVPVRLPEEVLARLRDRDAKVEQIKQDVTNATGAVAVKKQRTLFGELARLRREVGEAKFEFVRDEVIAFIREHADAPRARPPIVFGRHRELLRRFATDLTEKVGIITELLTGESTPKARQRRVNNFQDGKADAAVAGFDAAGVGYTLIRSCDVFIFEVDYTPALMKQAIDRIHRRGQDRECNIYWFVVDGTIDARIAKLFVAKDQVAQSALGDHLVGMFSPDELFKHPVFSDDLLAA